MSFSILYIITRLDRGGTVDIITSLSKTAKKRGDQVKIVTGLTEDGIKISNDNKDLDIIFINELRRDINFSLDIIAFFKIIYVIYKYKPTIVHTHTSKAGMLGRIAAKIMNVPIIIHTPHGHVFYGYFSKLKSKFIIIIEKFLSNFADLLVGISEGEIKETIKYGVGNNKFELIRTGIFFPDNHFLNKIDRKLERKKLNFKEEDIILGFFGRLELIKGIDILVDSFIEISKIDKRVKLMITGSGSLFNTLHKKIVDNNLEQRVLFMGWRDDIWSLLEVIDISVIPSRMEGMGKSAIESIFMKKPVIASPVGGLVNIIREEKFGILLPKLDKNNLTLKIIEMIERLPQFNKLDIDRIKIRKKYGNQYMIERNFNLYRKLLTKKGLK